MPLVHGFNAVEGWSWRPEPGASPRTPAGKREGKREREKGKGKRKKERKKEKKKLPTSRFELETFRM